MIDIIASFAAGAASGILGMMGLSALAWKQRDRVIAYIAARPVHGTWKPGDTTVYTTPED